MEVPVAALALTLGLKRHRSFLPTKPGERAQARHIRHTASWRSTRLRTPSRLSLCRQAPGCRRSVPALRPPHYALRPQARDEMIARRSLNETKKMAIVVHDLVMTALAVFVALELRFDEALLAASCTQLPLILAVTCLAPRSSTGPRTSTSRNGASPRFPTSSTSCGQRVSWRSAFSSSTTSFSRRSARPLLFRQGLRRRLLGLADLLPRRPAFHLSLVEGSLAENRRPPVSARRDRADPRSRARDRSGAARHPGGASGASSARPHLAA